MMITRFPPKIISLREKERKKESNSRFHPAIKRQTERFSPVSVPRSSAGSGLARSLLRKREREREREREGREKFALRERTKDRRF